MTGSRCLFRWFRLIRWWRILCIDIFLGIFKNWTNHFVMHLWNICPILFGLLNVMYWPASKCRLSVQDSAADCGSQLTVGIFNTTPFESRYSELCSSFISRCLWLYLCQLCNFKLPFLFSLSLVWVLWSPLLICKIFVESLMGFILILLQKSNLNMYAMFPCNTGSNYQTVQCQDPQYHNMNTLHTF